MTPVLDKLVSSEKGWHISFVPQLATEHVYSAFSWAVIWESIGEVFKPWASILHRS